MVCALVLAECRPFGQLDYSAYPNDEAPAVNAVRSLLTYAAVEPTAETAPAADEAVRRFERTGSVLALGQPLTYLGETAHGNTGNRTARLARVQTAAGDEVWISANFLVIGGLGVVVAERIVVYSAPTLNRPTEHQLVRGQIVGVQSAEVPNRFVRASGWDENRDVPHPSIYLRARDVSRRDADVQGALLLAEARRASTPDASAEILRKAAAYESSAFAAEISARLAELGRGGQGT